MNFRRGRAREEPEINLIPLIDILIVVLIFLFLTTTYSRFAELQINLPESAAEKSPDRPQVLAVAVDANGRYAINGTTVPFDNPAGLATRLQEAAKGAKEPVVAISADAAATHQSVVNVMEAARLAGYNHISFTTQSRK
ncbi:MAG: biopolymer transporter ExbD [Betaproteobacteria bacterium]|jgi:biopolymer transport protein ExbD|nr:biopolymer transporter ExbD [Betaproteobacteria bacterium]